MAGLRLPSIAAALLLAAILTSVAPAHAQDASFPKMNPCQEEDSRQCVWDAVHMGDGFGDSFWAPPLGEARVYYRHPVAHRLLNGTWTVVPDSAVGRRIDLINGGTRTVGPSTIRDLGDTTLWVWPGQDRLDYQVGTS